MRISVLGGKGVLGTQLTPLLAQAGHELRLSTRNPTDQGDVKADFLTGEGLTEAVKGADVVVHLVSDARKPARTDLAGTERLLAELDNHHLVYISIVGVDRHPLPYYRIKHQVEQLIETWGGSHSILRATQFHDFVAYFLGAACKPPVALIPKRFVFQPISTGEVARHLAEIVERGARGRAPDVAGPEVHRAEYLARTLMTAIGRERPILNLPVPGKAARAFREGAHTNPGRSVGVQTWEEYLEERASS